MADSIDVFNLSDEEFEAEFAKLADSPDVEEDTPIETSTEDTESLEDSEDLEEDTSTEESDEDDTADVTESSEDSDVSLDPKMKAEYDKIFAPFKANGVEMSASNADEVIRLMQQGVNYSKNMADLKPLKRVQKMLETHQLFDEDKLSFLISLSKGNKDSIKKLLADNDINPLDFDMEDTSEVQLPNYKVNDNQIVLEEVLNNVKSTPHGAKTLDIIGTQWDEESRTQLVKNPNAITHINEHVRLGIFDRIASVLTKQRALGNMAGVSFLDAYTQIGDTLHAQGAFNDLVNPSAVSAPIPAKAPSKPAPSTDPIKRKAAASIPKSNTKPKNTNEVDVWKLSDTEFDKLFNQLK